MHIEQFDRAFHNAYTTAKGMKDGQTSADLPKLQGADPNVFGLCAYHHDPQTKKWREIRAGDDSVVASAQSVSKVLNEAIARKLYGASYAKFVGSGSSERGYNEVAIDAEHRPVNGMMNFGAIANCILLHDAFAKRGLSAEKQLLGHWQDIAGRELVVDETVYRQDKACERNGDYNAHIEAFAGTNAEGEKLRAAWSKNGVELNAPLVRAGLDLFLRLCSLNVHARDLAKLAALFENRGVNPFTGNETFPSDVSTAVSGAMRNGGLYGETHEIAQRTAGAPAKSGISGAFIAHSAAGKPSFAFGAYSPPLSSGGNSVRAVAALEKLTGELKQEKSTIQ